MIFQLKHSEIISQQRKVAVDIEFCIYIYKLIESLKKEIPHYRYFVNCSKLNFKCIIRTTHAAIYDSHLNISLILFVVHKYFRDFF